jgi:N-glycosylase/DNA lyase
MSSIQFKASDYNLTATLASGQVFRWHQGKDAWEGVLQGRWVRLIFTVSDRNQGSPSPLTRPAATLSPHRMRGEGSPVRPPAPVTLSLRVARGEGRVRGDATTHNRPDMPPPSGTIPLEGYIEAQTAVLVSDWGWLREFLQLDADFQQVLATFPDDEPMRRAVAACRGLRLLRQDPWECLISFICSSTKQIVQIQEIIRLLCQRFGEPVAVPAGHEPAFAFPTPERLAGAGETDLRACKAGFRAPYILAAARAITEGRLHLQSLASLTCVEARTQLMQLHGVGRKIADCVLLFAYGFQDAFPVDVWVEKALQRFYFPKRRVGQKRLRRFSETHFGPFSGYAQQYLFHYARTACPEFKVRNTKPSQLGRNNTPKPTLNLEH